MQHFLSTILLSAAVCTLVQPAAGQQNNAAERLLSARALYYTPTASGLTSFHCVASFDWKDYLTRFSGKTIADDNSALVYLNATHLSVSDDLKGGGTLSWTNSATPPEGKAASMKQISDGMIQMFGGYFRSWNAYMNGTMVSAPDKTVAVTPDGEGIHLHSLTANPSLEESFDKNLLLISAHVSSADMDLMAYPTYEDSPDGRIVTSVHSLVHQPPTAPATDVTISTAYSKVGSFQLPSTVSYEIMNVGTFVFTFSGCEVTTMSDPAVKH